MTAAGIADAQQLLPSAQGIYQLVTRCTTPRPADRFVAQRGRYDRE